jgi:Ca2+-binding RTX toxin-like protein
MFETFGSAGPSFLDADGSPLAVYVGTNVAELTPIASSKECPGADWTKFAGCVVFRAQQGTTYHIATVRGVEDEVLNWRTCAVAGTAGNDTLRLAGPGLICGMGGSDLMIAGSPLAQAHGGAGTDTLSFADTTQGVRVDLGLFEDGNGHIFDVENITGSPHADYIAGGWASEVISGGAGDDLLFPNGVGNTVIGGTGRDTVGSYWGDCELMVDLAAGTMAECGNSSATLTGIENVRGSDADDVLYGNADANSLDGTYGNDYIDGRGGNDELYPGAGDDGVSGGLGTDRVGYAGSPSGVAINLAAGTATGWGTDTLDSIESATGTQFADVLDGTNSPNSLFGLAGNDALAGKAGNDTVNGGVGDDVLYPGTGSDSVDGAAGIDTIRLGSATAGVSADLTAGTATGGSVNVRITNVENLLGSLFADVIVGSAVRNVLEGGDSADKVYGRAGDDSLKGGNGNDYLAGEGGNDGLDGGVGTDTCLQGTGTRTGTAASCER